MQAGRYITPYRGKDGLLYCDPVCRKRGPNHRDNEVFTEHEWRTTVSADGVVSEVCRSWHAKQAKLDRAA